MNICTLNKIIEIIGENQIQRVYQILKSKPISFALLKKIITKRNVYHSLNSSKHLKEIAKENGVCLMTIYRYYKDKYSKKYGI